MNVRHLRAEHTQTTSSQHFTTKKRRDFFKSYLNLSLNLCDKKNPENLWSIITI